MKTTTAIVRNERGSVLVMALMVLTLLTIVAFTATRTSNIEIQISGNELLHQKYFFTADAGIARGIKDLEVPFVNANKLRVRTRTQATWDFALTGILDTDGDGQGRYEEGKVWISDAVLSGVRYNVTLWNNDDSTEMDEYFVDRDALIWLRADASGPRGGGSSVQILLQGDTTGESITGYSAQAGAGAGKNYNANDLNAIANFGRQL